ncbi:helix-turn-helix domain-containing protein [Secundilactobacillus kimchicus]|uniref:helix-turn-helix domain-containing protein n=1 Tax=Secundilactobacillus kimchicus TaxID=528209 RepID=UPI001C00E2CD|nr:helix-turn-helix domain-containing protein [Secundilactobacillus kimchicus]MBT9673109.1 helix-turn-helix domain-containing protein [Secundilactobacillus kimchicus]
MTKISKQTKLKALIEYFEGTTSLKTVAKKYQIHPRTMQMLAAAYRTHGTDVLLNPPKVTSEFRVKLAHWAEKTGASYTEVAAKFGYVGIQQIMAWRKIYRQKGPNGLLSITKGRKPSMDNKKRLKKKNIRKKASKTTDQQRIKELEDENQELRIKLEASKLLASMKQRTNKSRK